MAGTNRYILVTPKTDGVFSIKIQFQSAASSNNNRVYYMDFDADADVDLSSCTKNSALKSGSDMGTEIQTRTIDMETGHKYVIYTYQKASIISDMSFKYENEPEETEKPAKGGIIIKNKSVNQNTVSYDIEVNGIKDGILIAAVYTEDGRLYSMKQIENLTDISVDIPDGNSSIKFILWNSLSEMEPMCEAAEDKIQIE